MTISIPIIQWAHLMPLIIVVAGAVLVLLWDTFFPSRERSFLITLTMAVLAVAGGATLYNLASSVPGGAVSFGGMYVFDDFTGFMFILILVASFLSVLVSAAQPNLDDLPAGEYFSLILFATSGMMLMVSTRNLLMVFVGLEILSLSLYVLAGYLRFHLEGNEAALKYFLLGSFASGFLLFGMAMIYGATGSVDLLEIARRLGAHPPSRNPVFMLGMGFIVVGLGFKVAAVPFNMWTPDVYEGSPTAVTAFMSVGPKAAAFAAFFRIILTVGSYTDGHIEIVLWILAVLTMTVGNVVALWQSNIKRMLAYSSIAHAGYLLVALVAARSGGALATGGFLFYMLVYAFMNLGAFCVVVATGANGPERTQIDDYAGMGLTRPVLAVVMALFMVSLAGLPPTGGFVAKFYVFSAAVKAGYVWLAVIAVLNSVISVYYYLRLVVVMYMQDLPGGEAQTSPAVSPRGWSYAFVALLLTVIGTLNLGIFPGAVIDFTMRSTIFLN
ncbi:MAG: NADH-quinone oxidoreductase subunit N [bacterium]